MERLTERFKGVGMPHEEIMHVPRMGQIRTADEVLDLLAQGF